LPAIALNSAPTRSKRGALLTLILLINKGNLPHKANHVPTLKPAITALLKVKYKKNSTAKPLPSQSRKKLNIRDWSAGIRRL
jgi:hypothetical protein